MRITGAAIALCLWFAVMGAAVIVAGVLVWKKGVKGCFWASGTILGALMMFAFVSAVIGLYEMPPYHTKPAFYISLGIGAVGTWLYVNACTQLRKHSGCHSDAAAGKINAP